MRAEIELLVQLQGLDLTVARLKTGKKVLAAQAAEAERAADRAREKLEDRKSQTTSFQTALDSREIDLKETESRIARLEVQINTVKTNKEYAALQHEILGLKANLSKLEDDILQMMDQIETDRVALDDITRESEAAEAAAKERKEAIENALGDADARIERLARERAELTAKIPPKYLSPYERLLRKGDDRAMAACRGFVCEACRMSLTANTVSLLMAGDKLIFCHSCGRILYLARDEDVHGGIGAGRKV